SSLARGFVCSVNLSQTFGIDNREIVESRAEIWGEVQYLLVGLPGRSEIFQLLVNHCELHQRGSGLVLLNERSGLVLLNERREFCDRLFLPVRSDIKLGEQQVCCF